MPDAADLVEVERAIQLAIAPAFLLTATVATLNLLTLRLNRVIDRSLMPDNNSRPRQGLLQRRAAVIRAAIACAIVSAICISLLATAGFVGVFLAIPLGGAVGLLLLGGMAMLIATFLLFLFEVWLARTREDLPGP
ncbi:DUF2721 domain-containing protein [Teichococcus vastitatis]|uniref:DUF2721 domain-containing protein n=1 Tax=Teichococcus vastitatis TaxID=2307076 RepID=A0ABS9W050_9PROT|nr:DUF2721 domain-containing protein [Pseudoroseomonas vastitatis]MCI0752567.1 DUF2721 domain-containing protein [Pseudoroseomonas vastitatis]